MRKIIMLLSIALLIFTTNRNTIYARCADAHAGLHLIQGIDEQSEWEGMVSLGLMQTIPVIEENIEMAIEAVKPSVVAIKVEGYVGSGSIFELMDETVVIVSNKHLLMYDTEAEITFHDGSQVIGKVTLVSQQYDVGFVEVKVEDIPYATKMKLRKVSTNLNKAEEIDYGSEIFVIGSSDGVGKNISKGSVLSPSEFFEEFGSKMLRVYAKGKPGMSGGGTFDAYGNYIGMLTGGLLDESASLPLRVILEEYRSYYFKKNYKF